MPIVRKLIAPLSLLLMLFAASASASAAPLASTTRKTVPETVTWTLPANQCPALPAGVSVEGTGQRHSESYTKVNPDGSSQILINDLVTGSAVDSNGRTYRFVYTNHSTELVPASGLPHQISLTERFML